MMQRGNMKLLLRSLLLSSLCTLSSWSVSSETLHVNQSPNVSVQEGKTVNITCCWSKKLEHGRINWLKNQTLITETLISNNTIKKDNCVHMTFERINMTNSGRYTCKVTVEIPMLTEAEGNGTIINVTIQNKTEGPATGGQEEQGLSVPVIIALAVLGPLFLIAFACLCSLHRKQGKAAKVIHEGPHTDSIEAEMDKHSTSSSRGSTQWCQVPVYMSFDYLDVDTKGSK